MRLLILLLVLTSVQADWTEDDINRQLVYTTLHLVDWGQTLDIVDSDQHHENNVLLGEYPTRREVNQYFMLTYSLNFMITNYLTGSSRRDFQLISSGAVFGIVLSNRSIGLSVNF